MIWRAFGGQMPRSRGFEARPRHYWIIPLKDLQFKYFVMQAGDTSVDPNDDARKQVVHDHNGRGAVRLDGPVIGQVCKI